MWIYQTKWDYDGGSKITNVFDSKEKAEKWHKRMLEIEELHEKYHRDGTVDKYDSTYNCPEILALCKEARVDTYEGYVGHIVEMEIE